MPRLISTSSILVLLAACGSNAGSSIDDAARPDGNSARIDARGVDARSPDGNPGSADASPDARSLDASPSCPGTTTAGTMNGIAVCRTASGVPLLDHIFVILMENTTRTTLTQSTNTPYIHSLLASYASATAYHGVEHPSLPNYIALVSGDIENDGALDCDCQPSGAVCNTGFGGNCGLFSSACGCPQTQHQQLVDQLDGAGVSWRAYAEDMGAACNTTSSGSYAVKHVPFLYFPTLTDDAARCDDRVVDFADTQVGFAHDLPAARRFSFITPNMTHDMHDPVPAGATNLANGDAWLASVVPPILASAAYQQGGMLVIVWDEDDLSGVINPDDPIPLIVISPLAKQGCASGCTSAVTANHYSLLATIEDSLGVSRLGNAASASPLADFFPAN